ncbi:MAG: metalloregulator ArsR/SmtB family transcription factor [Xanthomonadales bacterium]|nr:metalloregulator ArsR/SmtB family transcription factor [Xanthomonadales bacterium]
MDNEELIRTLSVLGQETRLGIYRLLCEFGQEGACPSDIAEKLGVAAATLSFHLKTLTQAGLLDAEADGRFIRYRANHEPTRALVRFAAKHLCGLEPSARPAPPMAKAAAAPQPKPSAPATEALKTEEPGPDRASDPAPTQQQLLFDSAPQPAPTPTTEPISRPNKATEIAPAPAPPQNPPSAQVKPKPPSTTPTSSEQRATPATRIRLRPVRILFLSPGNAARGLIAETLTNDLGEGRFQALSAGSQPLGRVNRYALKQLELAGHATDGLSSKSWEEFVGERAPEFDLVIGLWSADAAPSYPQFRGRCQRTFWPIDDPATVTASVHDAERAFARCYQTLRDRIGPLLKRLGEQLDRATSAALA